MTVKTEWTSVNREAWLFCRGEWASIYESRDAIDMSSGILARLGYHLFDSEHKIQSRWIDSLYEADYVYMNPRYIAHLEVGAEWIPVHLPDMPSLLQLLAFIAQIETLNLPSPLPDTRSF